MNLYRPLFWIICLIAMFKYGANAAGNNSDESKTRDYEIVIPKRGFVGSSPSSAGMPDVWPPTEPSHFDKRYIRVTELPEQVNQGMRRIVLKLDEIDDKGNMVHQDLYFLYIDFSQEGIQIIPKNENDGSSRDDSGIRKCGMPFPFTFARSPGLGFKNGELDGYVQSTGRGVEFVRKKAKESDKLIQVEAAYFETGDGGKMRWYGDEIDKIRKEKSSVKFREKQEWANENDWLWTKMDRYDANGNIMMHCRQKKIGSIDQEPDWPITLRMTNENDWFTSQGSTNSIKK